MYPFLTSAQISIGVNSILGQILLLRELSVLFYGNELSYGITLAFWFLWAALGALLGRRSDRLSSKTQALAFCLIFLSLILPATIFFTRSAGSFFGLGFGEVIGLKMMVGLAALIQSLLGFTLGFTYTLACSVCAELSPSQEYPAGKTYLLEAIGAGAGGLAFPFLITRFDHLQIALGLTLINLAIATWILGSVKKKWALLPAVTLGVLLLFFPSIHQWIRNITLKTQWPDYQVLESVNSRYGNLTVLETGEQRSLYENGLLVFTVPDLLSAEEAVHFSLLNHHRPENVLLIGGGMGGALREILKYPSLKKVVYAELDPKIIEIGKKILSPENRHILDDPRLEIKNIDGRLAVKTSKKMFDVVLVNIPDPSTAQLNRFYTLEFFREVKRILRPKGMLALSLTSSENYLSIEQKNLLHSVYRTLKEVFASISILPGNSNFLFAGQYQQNPTPEILIKRLKERKISTLYVREYYIPYRLSPERRQYLDQVLEEKISTRINQDYSPVSYYYNLILWVTSFSPGMRDIFTRLLEMNLLHFFLGALAGMALFFLLAFWRRFEFRQTAALWAVATTGFAEISFEVILIVAFQMIYGYVYYKIGIILAGFMIGLALGSFWAHRHPSPHPYRFLIKLQGIICCYPLLLIAVLYLYSNAGEEFLKLSEPIFGFLPVVAGLMGGLQYPHAIRISSNRSGRSSKNTETAGLTYGVDLLGSCLGALLTASLLIPILGLYRTCLGTAAINLLAWGGMVLFGRVKRN